MKSFLFTLFLSIATLTGFSQQKMLTIEDAVLKQRTTLAPERLNQLQWIPNENTCAYVGKKDGKEVLITLTAPDMKLDTVLRVSDFSDAFRNLKTDEKEITKFPAITWESAKSFRFIYQNNVYLFSISAMKTTQLAKAFKDAEHLDYEPKTHRLAYVYDHNLYVHDGLNPAPAYQPQNGDMPMNKNEIITIDGTYGIDNGIAVHRNEFGITKGTFFSPKGTKLAFYKLTDNMVTDYKLMQWLKADTNHATPLQPTYFDNIKYPMAGNRSHKANVLIYNFAKKRTIPVETGLPDEQYLTNIAWSPDEEYLYIAVVNRDQNEMKLNVYDGTTGVFIKTLFTETSAKYVEPEKPLVFLKNDNKFVWFSERDGFNHLYLYASNGSLIKQLTKGNFDVTELLGFDEKATRLFYTSCSPDGLNRNTYMLEIKSGKVTPVLRNAGVHTALVSSNGQYVLDQYSSTEIPRRTVLCSAEGKEFGTLLNAKNPLTEYKPVGMRMLSINSTDGSTRLNCRMFYPPNFDSTKKYPVIVYVYGGPHVQLISNSWLGQADMWLMYMAQQGYITFTLDNRGSMNRGIAFEQATFRHLGDVEIEDQTAGLNFLKSQSYVDESRVGVFGWSFGGFMSTGLMTRKAGNYKVGVAGGPVIDWRLYEIMYTERYMDKPQDNPKGYANADLLNYVKNLKGKLLMIHGTNDNTVVWQHSLNYLKKSVDEGVMVDYFVYPGHEHNVLGPDRVHLMKKITEYFKEHL